MQFRRKTSGPHKGQAYPVDQEGRVSSVSKGPCPKGSSPLNKNKTMFKVQVPSTNAKPAHQIVPAKLPEAKVNSPPSTSGDVQTREETHENE